MTIEPRRDHVMSFHLGDKRSYAYVDKDDPDVI